MDAAHSVWNVAHGLVWAARREPGKLAIRQGRRALSYRALDERVNRLAHALMGLGLGPGDRLLLLLGDRLEHLEALLAAAKAGIVAAPVDHRWRPDEIRHAVDLYDPRAVLHEEATRPLLPAIDGPRLCLERDYEALLARADAGEALRPVPMEAPFVIGCTSGTSGLPKGIVLSHRSMLWRMPISLHPAVQEAAVVGCPDPEWGEAVTAFVQLRPGREASAADLIEHCRAHLASYKKPRAVEILAELPRTTSGKVARQALQRGAGR